MLETARQLGMAGFGDPLRRVLGVGRHSGEAWLLRGPLPAARPNLRKRLLVHLWRKRTSSAAKGSTNMMTLVDGFARIDGPCFLRKPGVPALLKPAVPVDIHPRLRDPVYRLMPSRTTAACSIRWSSSILPPSHSPRMYASRLSKARPGSGVAYSHDHTARGGVMRGISSLDRRHTAAAFLGGSVPFHER